MQKYLKNNKGFTLVEVIVVAVIVLVLAAVAIPLYNGYIRDSRAASIENTATSIANALGAAYQKNIPSAQVAVDVQGTNRTLWIGGSSTNPENTVLIPKSFTVRVMPGGDVTVSYPADTKVTPVTVRYLPTGETGGYNINSAPN